MYYNTTTTPPTTPPTIPPTTPPTTPPSTPPTTPPSTPSSKYCTRENLAESDETIKVREVLQAISLWNPKQGYSRCRLASAAKSMWRERSIGQGEA